MRLIKYVEHKSTGLSRKNRIRVRKIKRPSSAGLRSNCKYETLNDKKLLALMLYIIKIILKNELLTGFINFFFIFLWREKCSRLSVLWSRPQIALSYSRAVQCKMKC